jgi:hypothetical protein
MRMPTNNRGSARSSCQATADCSRAILEVMPYAFEDVHRVLSDPRPYEAGEEFTPQTPACARQRRRPIRCQT